MPFRLSDIRFAPTPLPSLAALCVLCLTLYLGHWQQGRAVEKQQLQVEFEARAAAPPVELGAAIADPIAMRFARATARGEWLAEGQIFVDNKFYNDAVGFHVITPLKIAGTDRYVLVNRGWLPRGAGYPTPPVVAVPPGPISVEGVLMLPGTRFLELAPATVQGNLWQNLTIERYREASKLDVLPLVLLARDTDTPLKPITEQPDARAEKHVEYMLTWYSLAATVVALWVALNLKLERATPRRSTVNEGNKL
jgi:surfeit locus 1 family protein